MSKTVRRAWTTLRAPCAVVAILLFSANGLLANQNGTIPLPVNQVDFIKWILTQGGLVVVLLAIVWSYRRDLVTVVKQGDERNKILIDLVRENTAALTKHADAVARCPFREI